jgi:hypothetical protein
MTNEAKKLLLECYRRMQEHQSTPRPPAWQKWDREKYDETTKFGPNYGFGEWFGEQPNAIRMRYRRAIDELCRNGMMTTYSRCGGRLSKVKLTAEGEAIAKSKNEI